MNNLQKHFCSYELSRELKEFGFDEECIAYYAYDYLNNQANKLGLADRPIKASKFKTKYLAAPLISQALEFLMEKYDIHFISKPYFDSLDPAKDNLYSF